jgi:hypothetical protein
LENVRAVSTVVQEHTAQKYPVPPRSDDVDIRQHRTRGLDVHHQIDLYFNLLPAKEPAIFHQWWDRFQAQEPEWSPLRTEMIVRSDVRTRLVGVVDLVLFRIVEQCSLELCLIDWKVSTDHEYNVYSGSLQLNLYKYLLETYYCEFVIDGKTFTNVQVSKMLVVFFSPDLHTVRQHTAPLLTTEVHGIIHDLQEQVNYSEPPTGECPA